MLEYGKRYRVCQAEAMGCGGFIGNEGLDITADSDTIMNLSNQRIRRGLPYYFDETGKEIMAAMKSGRLKVKGCCAFF